ncbi:hypothetical protein GPJ56_001163 [Histomonas meleagridis]|uniref:uncharacterized protein n=1 Tax=Histomonas meleagridis TaxID=135588 RepID=UPI003559763C|nr:hypothetical protein GPJ56_001163 [Histomonas meleagridis]KAH0799874.1 hypothetical protein GO595_006986 [Histomonas meleagridis]
MSTITFKKATGENFDLPIGNEPVEQTKFRVRRELGVKGDFEIKLYLRSYELSDDVIISSLHMKEGDFIAVRVLLPLPKENKRKTNQNSKSPSKVPPPSAAKPRDPNINALVNMGFSPEDAAKALEICGGNLDAAIECILSGNFNPPRSPPSRPPPPPPPPPHTPNYGGNDNDQIQKLVRATNIEEGIVREVYFSTNKDYSSAFNFLMSMK